uniref:SFRICE_011382 n=1 Tax=Spodoptera frugiperda TaxID=7108 RepID=A0A2H1VRM1_SPOFR
MDTRSTSGFTSALLDFGVRNLSVVGELGMGNIGKEGILHLNARVLITFFSFVIVIKIKLISIQKVSLEKLLCLCLLIFIDVKNGPSWQCSSDVAAMRESVRLLLTKSYPFPTPAFTLEPKHHQLFGFTFREAAIFFTNIPLRIIQATTN